MRSGFTLIEALVALVLFQFGMLAVAATSAIAARDVATANRVARAHAVARHRVELLRATICAVPVTGGAETSEGLREFWSVEAIGSRRIVTDSVDFALPRGRRARVISRASAICVP